MRRPRSIAAAKESFSIISYWRVEAADLPEWTKKSQSPKFLWVEKNYLYSIRVSLQELLIAIMPKYPIIWFKFCTNIQNMEETTQKHIGGSTFAHSPTSSATLMQISNLQTRTQTRGIMYTKLRVPREKMERKMSGQGGWNQESCEFYWCSRWYITDNKNPTVTPIPFLVIGQP